VGVLVLAGCGDDFVEGPLVCDDIGWPLGITPVILPPAPEFEVECADGWGNAVATREARDTVALPAAPWISRPDPEGGWIHVVMPEYEPGWTPWLEEQGVDPAAYPNVHLLLRRDRDGALAWAVADYYIWWADLVGDELWALGWDKADEHWLLVFDPTSGELLEARVWDVGPSYNLLTLARDPAGGAWISAFERREADDLIDQYLYRATTIHTLELVAMRTTEDPRQLPFGGIESLVDGGAVWGMGGGFEVIAADGSVRWTRPDGWGSAGDASSILVTSRVPTGIGAGEALRLEKVSLDDGKILWTREHRRFVPAEPESCAADGCALMDAAYPVLRPDRGYLLVGRHSYPSSSCIGQPLIMAVSAEGEAEWAHRVETCGSSHRVAFREDGKLELLGRTGVANESSTGAWSRWFDL
jgi:hypothetical protein